MIQLFNQDCMVAMAGMKDKQFQLAIVDPPYGIGASNDHCGAANGQRAGMMAPPTSYKVSDWDTVQPTKEYFEQLFRISDNQIIWGGNYFELHGTPCYIVWDKVNGGSSYADCELAWTSFQSATRLFRFRWQGMLQGDMKNKEKRIHPTQKPVRLYEWLLNNYAKEGDKILDTHLGSGSSAIAADIMGYDFTGYEIDADYFQAAKARLERHQMQGKLFG